MIRDESEREEPLEVEETEVKAAVCQPRTSKPVSLPLSAERHFCYVDNMIKSTADSVSIYPNQHIIAKH